MALDRRSFLRLSASVVAGGLVLSGCEGEHAEVDALDRPLLLEMLGPDRVRSLGSRYIAMVPSENSAQALRAAIAQRRSSPLHVAWARTSIEDAVREDFADGRTVIVDGWILSLTEARQCALFALAPS